MAGVSKDPSSLTLLIWLQPIQNVVRFKSFKHWCSRLWYHQKTKNTWTLDWCSNKEKASTVWLWNAEKTSCSWSPLYVCSHSWSSGKLQVLPLSDFWIALTELSQQLKKHQAKTNQITGTPPHNTVLTGWWSAIDLYHSLLLLWCEHRACTKSYLKVISSSRRMNRTTWNWKLGIFKKSWTASRQYL